jgi:hypothetical protein
MCPGTCADFLCNDCRKAARDDKQGAANYATLCDAVCATSMGVHDACAQARGTRAQLAKAEGDAEAHRLRCVSLGEQLEKVKRDELESDRRLREALDEIEALRALVDAAVKFEFGEGETRVAVIRIAGPASAWWVCPRDKDTERADTRDEAVARARVLAKGAT